MPKPLVQNDKTSDGRTIFGITGHVKFNNQLVLLEGSSVENRPGGFFGLGTSAGGSFIASQSFVTVSGAKIIVAGDRTDAGRVGASTQLPGFSVNISTTPPGGSGNDNYTEDEIYNFIPAGKSVVIRDTYLTLLPDNINQNSPSEEFSEIVAAVQEKITRIYAANTGFGDVYLEIYPNGQGNYRRFSAQPIYNVFFNYPAMSSFLQVTIEGVT